jgi:type IX secretion system substrate protein
LHSYSYTLAAFKSNFMNAPYKGMIHYMISLLKSKGRYTLVVISVLLIVSSTNAQYYPAGLGNSNLILWLTAADPTTLLNPGGTQAANGDFIATWQDKSGKANHASQTTGGIQPINWTNQLNGNGAVIFQNINQQLLGPYGGYQTIIAVRNMPGAGHYHYLFSSPANSDYSVRGGGAGTQYTDGPNVNDWSVFTGPPPQHFLNGIQTLSGNTANHIVVDEAQKPSNGNYSISNTFQNRGMNGNDAVYELLSYNSNINNTQRILLENYEANVWGLESSLPTSGYPVYTPPTITTFNKNLVGIGSFSSTDNYLSSLAGNTDGLGFSSINTAGGFLDVTGFVMAAHNGQNNTVTINSTNPYISSATPISQWNRTWNIQKFGGDTTGLVTVSFIFSDYNGSAPNTTFVYGLMYNPSDGSFVTGGILVPTQTTTITASAVSFGVRGSNLKNGYYTVITSTSIILPIILSNFSVFGQPDNNLLKWTTSQENGADHFDIQRGSDGAQFQTIGTVPATGNSSIPVNYSFTDPNPLSGMNYYRLKMVNQDGSELYSPIKSINFTTSMAVTCSIYPNPATDRIQVVLSNTNSPIYVSITSMQGAVLRKTNSGSSNSVLIPVHDLARGIYLVEVSTGTTKFVQKFMKN